MLDLPDNELLSAYIDGELTADERAKVEQLLNDNPEARQLVDELRSLSLSLQSLSPYKLDADLAERVLRQAEREMLAQPASPLPRFHQVDVPEFRPGSLARRFLHRRNFMWSALAIAVAVMLMLNESGRNKTGPTTVALGPDRPAAGSVDFVPSLEAVEEPAVAQASEPKESVPQAPGGAGSTAGPAMVARTAPLAASDGSDRNEASTAAPKNDTAPLLVLQCQLAENRTGQQSLAELLNEAGVSPDEPLPADGGPIELTLTTEQVRQIVSQLHGGSDDFTSFSFLPTAKTAPPRIPSAIGPDSGAQSEPSAAPADHGAGQANSFEVQAAGETPEGTVPPATTLKSPPLKDDATYRVRFVIKPAGTAPGPKP
ncbi:MAG: anti-sigma factor family protein [Thermoguttaceae bacterium]